MNRYITRRELLKKTAVLAGVCGAVFSTWSSGPVQADGGLKIYFPLVARQNNTANPNAPAEPQRLVFIHHSTGQNWLADSNGQLGLALRDNNFFTSDTNYGWGPDGIGNKTDIGHWWNWFLSPSRDTYLSALYAEDGQHCSYSRLASNPGGENTIVMFKSCFPNSNISGDPDDPPINGTNPLNGQSAGSSYMTVANVKGIYVSLLDYFSSRLDKLFVVITAPPLVQSVTTLPQAANARAVNRWLVNDWLRSYAYKNVSVFDFYNILTSNGGSTDINDASVTTGNHHRFRNNAVEYITDQGSNYCAYGSSSGDSHPTPAGGQKASIEYLPLLNVAYNRWKGT